MIIPKWKCIYTYMYIVDKFEAFMLLFFYKNFQFSILSRNSNNLNKIVNMIFEIFGMNQ